MMADQFVCMQRRNGKARQQFESFTLHYPIPIPSVTVKAVSKVKFMRRISYLSFQTYSEDILTTSIRPALEMAL